MKTQLLGAISSSKAEVLRLRAERKEVVQRHKVSLTPGTCSCMMAVCGWQAAELHDWHS